MLLLAVLVLSAAPAALAQLTAGGLAANSPVIDSITPTSGSLAGGTQLTIYGSNFAADPYYTGINSVMIGNGTVFLPCLILQYQSTSSMIVCETEAPQLAIQVRAPPASAARWLRGRAEGRWAG